MTSDPTKAKEFMVKINEKHLNRVMDEKEEGGIMNSVLVENYIPKK